MNVVTYKKYVTHLREVEGRKADKEYREEKN